MTEFLLFNLIFTIVPLVEYGVLNSCTVIYNNENAKINNMKADINNLIIKEVIKIEQSINDMATQEIFDTSKRPSIDTCNKFMKDSVKTIA